MDVVDIIEVVAFVLVDTMLDDSGPVDVVVLELSESMLACEAAEVSLATTVDEELEEGIVGN